MQVDKVEFVCPSRDRLQHHDEQRDVIADRHEFIGQIGDDALGAAVELGGNCFHQRRDLRYPHQSLPDLIDGTLVYDWTGKTLHGRDVSSRDTHPIATMVLQRKRIVGE